MFPAIAKWLMACITIGFQWTAIGAVDAREVAATFQKNCAGETLLLVHKLWQYTAARQG